MPVMLIRPRRIGDDRGWFVETYHQPRYAGMGIAMTFVQDNHSVSRDAGVLRGLHYQQAPHAQDKLIRCVRGAIWDVAVDIRRGSPTFGRWIGTELSAANGHQLFVPVGFAHGFLTLLPDTEVEYKCSAVYAPESEGGVMWNDPVLALPWPLDGREPILSARDRQLPPLDEATSPFAFRRGDRPLGVTGA